MECENRFHCLSPSLSVRCSSPLFVRYRRVPVAILNLTSWAPCFRLRIASDADVRLAPICSVFSTLPLNRKRVTLQEITFGEFIFRPPSLPLMSPED